MKLIDLMEKVSFEAMSAKLSGINVNLFFYRKGKNGNWNALLCSDLNIDAKVAF